MVIVADSGGTKTDWLACRGRSEDLQNICTTAGMNPSVMSESAFCESVREFVDSLKTRGINKDTVEKYVLYIAGNNSDQTRKRILKAFKDLSGINSDRIRLHSDLEGAARALFKTETGVACIIGTGSAAGLYNGSDIIETVPSLGYVLGDEGSGAAMGKALINSYFKHLLSPFTSSLLEKRFSMDLSLIIENVYRKPGGNKFLASFVPFIKENEELADISNLIDSCLKLFFKNNVLNFKEKHQISRIGFVGGVASAFEHRIKNITVEYGLEFSGINSRPITELGRYHAVIDEN